MTREEVRTVNANQLKEKVYFHLVNGKTLVRTMHACEIIKANRIGNLNGDDFRIEEYIRLFNEKYSEPQTIRYVELSESEKRFFELHNMRKICCLPPDEEEEYQELLNTDE